MYFESIRCQVRIVTSRATRGNPTRAESAPWRILFEIEFPRFARDVRKISLSLDLRFCPTYKRPTFPKVQRRAFSADPDLFSLRTRGVSMRRTRYMSWLFLALSVGFFFMQDFRWALSMPMMQYRMERGAYTL